MREEMFKWIVDAEKDHSFCLLTIPVKLREELALCRDFAVETFLPESKVNWSLPASELPGGEMPLCYSIKVCESSLYALAEGWEERFAALCVTISYPLRETALEDAGKIPGKDRRKVLHTILGRTLLCARYCVYRL